MAKAKRNEKLVKSIYMANKSKGHNKFYKIAIYKVENEQLWIVRKNWGPIGAPKGTTSEFETTVLSRADTEYKSVVQSKMAKGYTETAELEAKTLEILPVKTRVHIEDTLAPRFKNITFLE